MVVSGRLEQRSWETEQGEKRSIVEIVADDVARELAVRDRRSAPRRAQRSGRQWARPASARGRDAAAQPAVSGGYDEYGEEPF